MSKKCILRYCFCLEHLREQNIAQKISTILNKKGTAYILCFDTLLLHAIEYSIIMLHFQIPINTLGAVNKFLENNVPARKRVQVRISLFILILFNRYLNIPLRI